MYVDSLISALTLSYLLPAAAHIFLFLPIRQWLLRVEYFSGCLIIMIHSIHYFRQVRNNQYENNTKRMRCDNFSITLAHPSYYYFELIHRGVGLFLEHLKSPPSLLKSWPRPHKWLQKNLFPPNIAIPNGNRKSSIPNQANKI